MLMQLTSGGLESAETTSHAHASHILRLLLSPRTISIVFRGFTANAPGRHDHRKQRESTVKISFTAAFVASKLIAHLLNR
jgi:hypothetical protein